MVLKLMLSEKQLEEKIDDECNILFVDFCNLWIFILTIFFNLDLYFSIFDLEETTVLSSLLIFKTLIELLILSFLLLFRA